MGNFWDALFKWSRGLNIGSGQGGRETGSPRIESRDAPPPAPDWYAPRRGSIDPGDWRPHTAPPSPPGTDWRTDKPVPQSPAPVGPPDSFIHPVMPVPPAGPIQMPVKPPGGEVVSGNIGAGIPGSFLAQLEELRRRKGQGLGSFGGM